VPSLNPGIVAILEECSSYRTPALILNPKLNLVFHAHFVEVSKDSITVNLANNVVNDADLWLKIPRLFISFSHNGNCCAFFAEVMEYRDKSTVLSPALKLKVSSKIIGMESRMSYRVPIGEKFAPSVRMFTKEGRVFLPKPIDLSYTGILIEFDKKEDPNFQPSDEVRLELRLDKYLIQLKAVVKRRDGNRYGLFFPEIVTQHGINPPQALQKIVASLAHVVPSEESLRAAIF
jgi:hypothetical protein